MTILEQVKIRLRQFHKDEITGDIVFDDVEENPILEQLINEAWNDVKTYRHYPPTWETEKIETDLLRYENIVVKLVMYDYIKEGADFESSNNENGETRTYISRETILNDVVPLVTVL